MNYEKVLGVAKRLRDLEVQFKAFSEVGDSGLQVVGPDAQVLTLGSEETKIVRAGVLESLNREIGKAEVELRKMIEPGRSTPKSGSSGYDPIDRLAEGG